MAGAVRRCAYSAQNWIERRREDGAIIGPSHDEDVVLAHKAADAIIALTQESK
jgi:hypothetical protein